MIRKWKLVLKMIAGNWITLLYFEIGFKTFGFTVVIPFIQYLLRLLPGLLGLPHIGQDNVAILLRDPSALFLAGIILILTALYVTFEITAFMVVCEKGWRRENISLFQLAGHAFGKTASLLKPSGIGVFFMLLFLMFSVFSPISGYLKSFRIPEFILEFIRGDLVLYGVFISILAVFHLLLLLYLFGLPAMLFSGQSFLGSWRVSLHLLKGRKIKTAWTVAGLTGLFLSFFLGGTALLVLGLGIYMKVLYPWEEGRNRMYEYLSRWLRIIGISGSTLTAAFLCGVIVLLYHQYQKERQTEQRQKKPGRGRILFKAVSAAVLLCAMIMFSETEIGGGVFLPYHNGLEIIAHRAGAYFAPENTLGALTKAMEQGADGVEADVQQLGDGTLVILHDTNLKRTTGVDLDVWDADYDAIQRLDAAAYYGGGGWRREKVPALDEFLRQARGKIKVMLELKISGHEEMIEQRVLDMVRTYGMEDQCMIASMDLDILRRVKELAPDMETVYISMLLITNQYDLEYVDSYSVETTSLSRGMAFQAHLQGKKLYGWTANSSHSIKKALSCNVDGLITDNPEYAAYFVDRYGDSLLAEDIVGLFYGE